MKQKLTEFKPHNIRRRLQRKDSKIAEQKENIRRLENKGKASHRASTKRIQSRANYYQKKCMDLQEHEEEETYLLLEQAGVKIYLLSIQRRTTVLIIIFDRSDN